MAWPSRPNPRPSVANGGYPNKTPNSRSFGKLKRLPPFVSRPTYNRIRRLTRGVLENILAAIKPSFAAEVVTTAVARLVTVHEHLDQLLVSGKVLDVADLVSDQNRALLTDENFVLYYLFTPGAAAQRTCYQQNNCPIRA